MNLLFTFADVPLWAWIAVAGVAAVAIILIVLIIVLAGKKSKGGNAETQKKASPSKSAAEEPVKKTKPAEAAAKEEKPEPKAEEKSVKNTETKAEEKKPEEPAKERDNGKVYHISKRKTDGKWQIKLEGGAKAIKLFDTQAEAVAYGKTLAENQDARFVLHKLDGSFRKLTY
ncbi:MAG: DUF2188 domain-containing protein [Clostridia bacterium]|nr:DUF2188 domain-containing protein [Clostridia bacterium]